ncbi:alpha-beta hydrolase superfamily lysophospholipase [Frondihabitans sp. PhB188]|uniref:alpha/beta fold hydrolase n=1 Tax=Frondihabitans sp. PhB188 TaxID=2485200 RepID=UPI000F4A4B7F|nr:alpha/beta hydrolase [Frondihabitans sp. PhB188]ROQ39838.1 alpha-beta hydrolase superfamily lysophospholipase [Frondihabitans sp. PhB188]
MARDDRTLTDAHGVVIHYYVWAASAPRGIVQLAHGVGEYALRYERLAEALAAAGYTVYADDHRGHGRTGIGQWGEGSPMLGHLGPGGLPATVEAVRDVTRTARADAPGLPLVLLGHSWGSLMAQIIVDAHADDYDGAVLTGTAYRTPLTMNGGDLNKRHAHLGTTGFEWLSRDPAVAAAMAVDPLAIPATVLKLFGLRDALRLYGRPTRHPKRDLPLLVMVGDDDPLGGRTSAEKLVAAYRDRSGFTDVELIVYDGARHEVFNETNRDEVTVDLIGWLDARSAVPA